MFTGSHLRTFRQKYHLTQQQIADYCHVLPREVRRWEHDDVAMPLHRRLLLARLAWDMVRQVQGRRYEPCHVCMGAGKVPKDDRINDREACQAI
jgi:transcriptional regulator with XRE-family HTH domain